MANGPADWEESWQMDFEHCMMIGLACSHPIPKPMPVQKATETARPIEIKISEIEQIKRTTKY